MNKKNIILDLDNTLLNSLTFKEVKNFSQSKAKLFDYVDMDKSYRVYLRPYLQKFLDFLFENYNVSIWTAASKSYATFIIDNIILIKPERKLDLVLFSYHCSYSKKFLKCAKDIMMLWEELKLKGYTRENTTILDDLPEIHKTLPNYTIKAKYFDVLQRGSENDKFLLNLISKLKSES
jgi:TFIIF-interacting CTD phosphatase-like protein